MHMFEPHETLAIQCDIDKGAPCKPCKKLAALQAQISDVEALLESLKAQRFPIRTERNRIHDPIIHKAPPKISSHIFSFCLLDETPIDYLVDVHPSMRPSLILSAVCRTWRDIAISIPHLWSSLRLKMDSRNPSSQLELAEQWLGRSGDVSLTIILEHDRDELQPQWEVRDSSIHIEFFNRYRNRCRVLKIRAPYSLLSYFTGSIQDVSSLQELDLCSNYRYRNLEEPSLFHVTLSPTMLSVSHLYLSSINISWDNLTSLVAGGFFLDDFEVLRKAPQLLRCEINFVERGNDGFPIPSTPIIHPRLQYLRFVSPEPELSSFFDHVALPSLNQLVLWTSQPPTENLKSFLTRSLCPLTRLSLSFAEPVDVIALLYTLPLLKELEITSHSNPCILDAFFEEFGQTDGNLPMFLPRLECFRYVGKRTFAWRSLLHLCETPKGPSANHASGSTYLQRPLRRVTLSLYDQDIIDIDVLLTIIQLQRNSKINFDIRRAGDNLIASSILHHGIRQVES